MVQARPIQTNFTAGELSPRLRGRVDVDRYANGCATLLNFQVLPAGGATRRCGTYYAGAVKTAGGRVRLVRFVVSTIAAYVLEFGNLYVRFWRNRALVESGGSPVELVTPYTTAQLRELRFAQSNDVLYITHPSHAPRKLSRLTATSFSLAAVSFSDGPYAAENITDTTITPGSRSGTVTLTASAATFAATDVGRLVALRDEAPARAASTAYSVGDVFHADDRGVVRVYRVVTAGTTAAANMAGTTPDYDQAMPTGEDDAVRDGTAVLRYLGRGKAVWGWGTISAFTSSTSVNATVATGNSLPATTATKRWKLGEWGGTRGWPRAVTFFSSRTVWGGAEASPQTLWFSQVGDYENMGAVEPDGTVLDTNAVTLTLDDPEVNTVRWLVGAQRGLFVGTPSGEFAVGPASEQQAFGPSNYKVARQGDRGSGTDIAGLRVGGVILFVQRGGKRVRELTYDFGSDSFQTPDLTILSDHVLGAGAVEVAHQENPDGVLWLVRSDGALVSLTFDREQQVRAWARHVLGGVNAVVESVAAVPNPDGTDDDVYLAVSRTVGGSTVRWVEWMRPAFRADLEAAADGFFVDAGLTYDGAAATTITGLSHLNGETVAICADGAERPTQVVSGGQVVIEAPAASVVHVGLPYTSTLTTLPPEVATGAGSAQGKTKRVSRAVLRLHESMGGMLGRGSTMDAILYRTPFDDMGAAVPLFTGDKDLVFPAGYDEAGQVTITTAAPLPLTVLAVVTEVNVHG